MKFCAFFGIVVETQCSRAGVEADDIGSAKLLA